MQQQQLWRLSLDLEWPEERGSSRRLASRDTHPPLFNGGGIPTVLCKCRLGFTHLPFASPPSHCVCLCDECERGGLFSCSFSLFQHARLGRCRGMKALLCAVRW